MRSLRIPNWLTFGGLGAALAIAAVNQGGTGLYYAALGAAAALVVLILPYALGWLGAGDVKAMMVLGALWGPEFVLPTLYWMALAGGALAVGLVAVRGELGDLLVRWWRSFRVTLATRRATFFRATPGSAAAGGLPFAVAIGVGASLYQIWGAP